MLVELKNGETLNGHLVNCDNWMNLTLKEVVQTSPVRRSIIKNKSKLPLLIQVQEGDKFVRLPEVYVKGNNVRNYANILDSSGHSVTDCVA